MTNRDNHPQIIRRYDGTYRVLWVPDHPEDGVFDDFDSCEDAQRAVAEWISAEFDNHCQ
jgi:hypothetical protein